MECQHKSNVNVLGLDLDLLEMSLEDAFTAQMNICHAGAGKTS